MNPKVAIVAIWDIGGAAASGTALAVENATNATYDIVDMADPPASPGAGLDPYR